MLYCRGLFSGTTVFELTGATIAAVRAGSAQAPTSESNAAPTISLSMIIQHPP